MNIGANNVYVINASNSYGYNITGTGTVTARSWLIDNSTITLNGKSLGMPHIFGGEGSYQIFVGIGSAEGLSFTVQQGSSELTCAVDDQYSSQGKLHLTKSGDNAWITGTASGVKLTVTTGNGGSVVYDPLPVKTETATPSTSPSE